MAGGVEYQVTKVDPTNPETKGMVYQVHKVTEEVAATLGGKVYRARIIKDPSDPTVAGKVYQIVLIGDPSDPAVKGKVYNAILTGDSEVVVVGPAVSPISLPDAIADSLEYLKAFGGTEQRNLPAEYTQVEYISNDSSAKHNTGLLPQDGDVIEIRFKVLEGSVSNYIFQSRAGAGASIYGIGGAGAISGISGSNSGSSITSAITRTPNHIYYVKVSFVNGVLTLYVKDETAGTEDTQTDSYTFAVTDSPYYIWGNSYNTLSASQPVYFLKITNGNTTRLNYVPARQDTTAGFYDLATNTFISTMTQGAITAGADVVPTPDTPMDIVSNNGVLKVVNPSGVPLAYTELAYIESTGTQYIDTGVVPTGDMTFEVKGKYNDLGTGVNKLFGSRTDAGSKEFIFTASSQMGARFNIGYGTNSIDSNGIDSDTNTHVFRLEKGTGYVDSTEARSYTQQTFTGTYSIYLFSANYAGSPNGLSKTTIEYAKAWNGNGELIFNGVPAKRNSDNVIGMYDTVSGQFFTNAGTDTFTAGNAVSPVVIADGTVETINVHSENLAPLSSSTDFDFSNNILSNIKTDTRTNIQMQIQVFTGGIWRTIKTISVTSTGVKEDTFDIPAEITSIRIKHDGATKDLVIATGFVLPEGSYTVHFDCLSYNPTVVSGIQLKDFVLCQTPYYNGGTATAEMLLKVGTYQDVQSIIDGAVTRNVGIKVLNGTENWFVTGPAYLENMYNLVISDMYVEPLSVTSNRESPYSTHFERSTNWIPSADRLNKIQALLSSANQRILGVGYLTPTVANLPQFKSWLTDQYNAGTPVIVVYPLETPTTESVTGQTMQVQQGDNIVEITQASLNNLEIEAKYEKEGA